MEGIEQIHNRERRRIEELMVLNRVTQRIGTSLDLRETLDGVVEAAAELVPCVLAEISLWDERRQMLTLQALRCEPERVFPIGETYPPGEGYTGWVVRNKKPLLVLDVEARHDIRPQLLPGELPFRAYVGLPLMTGDELIGTLVLVHDQAQAFDEDDLRLLEGLAGQAAVAIRNARLYEETQRKARKLAALNAVASVINRPLALRDIMDRAVVKVLEVMEADYTAIQILDPESGDWVVVSHQEIGPASVPPMDEFLSGEEIRRCLDRLQAAITVRGEDLQPRLTGLTLALAPLRTQGDVVGILEVSTHQQREFTLEDLGLLTAIGHQLSMAIENAHLRQRALDDERLAAVGRVAASVAHDLRSPLGGIIRSAEFLARPELSDSTRAKLSHAIAALARRLINTAQEILDFTQGGQMALQLADCSLPEFLKEVIEVLRVDFSDQGIEVLEEYEYTGNVWMDPDRMAQVVYNVASNARDAMPEGGRLTITTRRVDDWVELRFSDTGPGIPPELSEQIFEPFVSYGKREGAGLGLAIARRIMREHGGQIRAESEAGGGATFVVRLSLDPHLEATDPQNLAGSTPAVSRGPQLRSEN